MAAAVAVAGASLAGAAWAEPDQGSIARGGKLYDKWYKVVKAEKPTESHKLYPADKAYADDPGSNWRCKECHGWDGMGAAGAYSSGKHFSGIVGINGKIGADPAQIVGILKGAGHGFGDKLTDEQLGDLANFVAYGQETWSTYIVDGKIVGDAAVGAQVYATTCVNCHGVDGKLPKDMPPLGSLVGNPWEVMHKVLNGQPDEAMPGLRAFDHQYSADVVAYFGTLPAE